MGVAVDGALDRGARHGEDVGRRREEGEGDVVSALGLDHVPGQGVDGHRDADVRLAVGVDVVADRQRALEGCHPPRDGPEVVDEVAAGTRRKRAVTLTDGHGDRPGESSRVGDEPVPQVSSGEVDGRDVGSPPEQGPQRPHLGGCTEHDHGAVGQVEPVGVVDDTAHGLGAGGLDGAGLDPEVEATAQRVPREALTGIRHGQHAVGRALATEGLGPHRLSLLVGCERGVEGVVSGGVRPAHPPVQGFEATGRDGLRGTRDCDPRLDEAPEVRQVALAPVGLALGRRGAHGVHTAQGVSDDGPSGGGRAAASGCRVEWEDHSAGVAHGPILPECPPAATRPTSLRRRGAVHHVSPRNGPDRRIMGT